MASDTEAVAFSAEVARLAKEFELKNGRVALSDEAFARWVKVHRALPAADKAQRAPEVIALAVRFVREGGDGTLRAFDQLCLLAAELIGEAKAKAAMKAAGVGWGPKAKSAPAGEKKKKGWG